MAIDTQHLDADTDKIKLARPAIMSMAQWINDRGTLGRVVDSIAEMKALDKTKNTRTFVTGYYASGDGGGGAYWYDSTDTTTADNGGTVIVAADGGRWKLTDTNGFTVKTFGAKCDGVTDDTAAAQAAIDYCATFARWPALVVPGRVRLTAPLKIDRMVDTTISEFRIIGEGAGAGFVVDAAVTMFDSNIAVTTDPKSEHIAFEGIHFECTDNNLNAYVLSQKFLRVRFDACFFQYIRCMVAAIYAQDFRFLECKARGWKGAFFASQGAYAVKSVASVYEFGGSGFYLPHPTGATAIVGCSFAENLYEGCSGPFITGSFVRGMGISDNYFEANTGGALAFNYSLPNEGISHKGNLYVTDPAKLADPDFFEIKWGVTTALESSGNYCNGRLHDAADMPGKAFHCKDYAALEAIKGQKGGVLDPARTAATGRVVSSDDSGLLYITNGQRWAALDGEFGGLAVGPGVVQGGEWVPVRIVSGAQNPGANNAYYGNPYWTVGSRIFNSSPVVGQPKGWVCTASGNPGTWVSEGNL